MSAMNCSKRRPMAHASVMCQARYCSLAVTARMVSQAGAPGTSSYSCRAPGEYVPSLKGKTVLVIGRGSGIARAIVMIVSEAGGRVIVAGRSPENLAGSYRGMDIGVEHIDVTDEPAVAALAARIAPLDHVVCTASARARGGYADLTASLVNASFGTKVTGPLLLARHFARH